MVPFETSSLAFFRTLWDLCVRPGAMFGALPRGRLSVAYLFCVLSYGPVALAWAVGSVVGAEAQEGSPDSEFMAALCFVLISPAAVLFFGGLRTVVTNTAALALGGQAHFVDTARAYLYAGGYASFLLPGFILLAVNVGLGGGLLLLGGLLGMGFRIRALYAFLRGRHRLGVGSSIATAVLPSALYWGLTFALVVLVAVLQYVRGDGL